MIMFPNPTPHSTPSYHSLCSPRTTILQQSLSFRIGPTLSLPYFRTAYLKRRRERGKGKERRKGGRKKGKGKGVLVSALLKNSLLIKVYLFSG